MKESISYAFYKRMTTNYILAPTIVSAILAILLCIEPSFWLLYIIMVLIIYIAFLPFILVMAKRMRMAKRAESYKTYDCKIIKLEPELSLTPRLYLKAIVEIKDNGRMLVQTYPVLNPKRYNDLKNKEIQIAYEKGQKRAFILMIY